MINVPLTQQAADQLFISLKLEGFFPSFEASQVAKLFLRSGLHVYTAGSHVFEQGDAGRDLYVVIGGVASASTVMGSAGAELGQLRPGDIFGEMGLVHDGVRRATISAIEDLTVFRLSFDDVQYLLKHHPPLGEHLRSLAKQRQG